MGPTVLYELRSPWVKPPMTVMFWDSSREANSSPTIEGSWRICICFSMLSKAPGMFRVRKSGLRFSSWVPETIDISTDPFEAICRVSCCAPRVSLGKTSIPQAPPVDSSSVLPKLSSAT